MLLDAHSPYRSALPDPQLPGQPAPPPDPDVFPDPMPDPAPIPYPSPIPYQDPILPQPGEIVPPIHLGAQNRAMVHGSVQLFGRGQWE